MKHVRPDHYHHGCDCILLCLIALIVWPCYWNRLRDYFRHMAKAFRESREEFLE